MKTWCLILTALLTVAAGCATTGTKSTASLERGAWIAVKLGEAERLGAKECSPRSLAQARVALDRAMHEAGEGYYSDAWLEPDFAAADKLADDLLAQRRLAASLGRPFLCVSASRSTRADGFLGRGPDPLPVREQRLRPWPAGDYLVPAGEFRSRALPVVEAATN